MFFNLLHVVLNCINELAGFYRLIAALQGLFLESPENFSDSRFARRIREICENRPFPRHFFTILEGFVLFNPLRTNFGACGKLTIGLTLNLRKVLCKSLRLREYKTYIE